MEGFESISLNNLKRIRKLVDCTINEIYKHERVQ